MANGTRQRIIEAAKVLFQKKSYSSVGVREIAKQAGCSHTAIYLYFKNKDEILYEVTQASLEELYKTLKKIMEDGQASQDKLLLMAHAYLDFAFTHQSTNKLLFLVDGERVELEKFDNPVNTLRIKCFRLLEELLNDLLPKSLTDLQKLNIARGLYLFMQGMVANYAIDGSSYNNRLREVVTDYLGYTVLRGEK
ncbi:TetR/AcrR family transcriptional regulator [Streptococcus downei]|uniref:Transcriptional regulator n=1 Tax=Streptococcus downei MFe28 TaxID=764290 RepID=A0A380JIC8_STRDO|nr:TetR/AcrR family transcriptional regulator [Streptococcus downei]EFQ56491.1 transcriptional regulator, TetR family [Streptococcus downei F0415]SUN37421.1 transcriptional regulator [Streptococcus downei MFe28]